MTNESIVRKNETSVQMNGRLGHHEHHHRTQRKDMIMTTRLEIDPH